MGQALGAFWAEMSACEHFVQIYEADDQFMDTLTSFVSDGVCAAQAVVVIATPIHRRQLVDRLTGMGLDLAQAMADDQLILLDAEETISKFMRNDWPDEDVFASTILEILGRASQGGRKVRAFGEMVAIMWARGYCGATVRLEHLWHQLCQKESFPLFCAYPRTGFTQEPAESIAEVCAAHSKVLAA
jgi:hypothetical protein